MREEPAAGGKEFDLDHYIHSGAMGQLLSREPLQLQLRCDRPMLSHLDESPLGIDQIIENVSYDQFNLTVTVGDTQDLRWWLVAQAGHLDILGPEWLREAVREELQGAADRQASMN